MNTVSYKIEYFSGNFQCPPDWDIEVFTDSTLDFAEELPDGELESPIEPMSEYLELPPFYGNHTVLFCFNRQYSDFTPGSVEIRQSSLPKAAEWELKGRIRALYDIYHARRYGIKGYPAFVEGGENFKDEEWRRFYKGMQAVYCRVKGFERPRPIATISARIHVPPKEEPQKFNITQEEAAKVIAMAYKNAGLGKSCSEKTVRNWESGRTKPKFNYSKSLRRLSLPEFGVIVKMEIARISEEREARKSPVRLSARIREAHTDFKYPE